MLSPVPILTTTNTSYDMMMYNANSTDSTKYFSLLLLCSYAQIKYDTIIPVRMEW